VLSDASLQSLRDRELLLRSLDGFAPLPGDAIALLAEHSRVRAVREGERLLVLGEPIHHVYVVLAGSVRWQRKGRPPQHAGAQQVAGWLTLMARDPNGMDAVVERDSLVLELPADTLELALEDDFAIVRNMLRMGAHQLITARGQLPAHPGRVPPLELGEPRVQRRTLAERIIAMREVPIFKRCNIEALISLVRTNRELRAEPGEVFWNVGDYAPFWLLVEYGHVRCANAEGQVMDVGTGFVLGIMDAIAQVPRSYSARAESPVIGNRIDLASFMGVLEMHAELAREFLAFLALSVLDQA
jgi:CRP-like cAMP-binding protein